ncbi:DUF3899 domain-containing protein [Paenibacillus jiagnxiensis]|uniref:DUF3899 domain-containing protein n=1 Tax=Paenibacillus jiagnxiensis TaxID=3228926 RepID=UPI0033A333AA
MLLRTIAVTGLAAGITWLICNGSVQAAVTGTGPVSAIQGGQEAANRLFLYGMLALVVGALAYVRNTGFFAPLSKGLNMLQGVRRTSRSLQRENERLMQDEALQSWKLSLYRGLSWYSVSIGGGLVLASTVWLLQTAN